MVGFGYLFHSVLGWNFSYNCRSIMAELPQARSSLLWFLNSEMGCDNLPTARMFKSGVCVHDVIKWCTTNEGSLEYQWIWIIVHLHIETVDRVRFCYKYHVKNHPKSNSSRLTLFLVMSHDASQLLEGWSGGDLT